MGCCVDIIAAVPTVEPGTGRGKRGHRFFLHNDWRVRLLYRWLWYDFNAYSRRGDFGRGILRAAAATRRFALDVASLYTIVVSFLSTFFNMKIYLWSSHLRIFRVFIWPLNMDTFDIIQLNLRACFEQKKKMTWTTGKSTSETVSSTYLVCGTSVSLLSTHNRLDQIIYHRTMLTDDLATCRSARRELMEHPSRGFKSNIVITFFRSVFSEC